nr:MAG TPA: hypothetical protein [Caudoviricetes sp.]
MVKRKQHGTWHLHKIHSSIHGLDSFHRFDREMFRYPDRGFLQLLCLIHSGFH